MISKPIDIILEFIENDLQLHERLNIDDNIKLIVDIDKYKKNKPNLTLETILSNIADYLGITQNEISYTTNSSIETGSHHIVIPRFHMSVRKQKHFWNIFKKRYGYVNEIDTGIFCEGKWFRLPNQTKEQKIGTEHIIQQGILEDFVLKYIDNSIELSFDIPEVIEPLKLPSPSPSPSPKREIVSSPKCENDKWIDLLMNVIRNDLDENEIKKIGYDDFLKICTVLKCNSFSFDTFYNWSSIRDDTNISKKTWDSIKMTDMNIGLLVNMAKIYNAAGLKEWYQKWKIEDEEDKLIFETINSNAEYDFAVLFNFLYGDYFKCISTNDKNLLYHYQNHIWNKENDYSSIRNKLSKDLFLVIDNYKLNLQKKFKATTDEDLLSKYKKQIQKTTETAQKLKKTADKTNITKEIADLIKDAKFENNIDNAKFQIPIKNGKMLCIKKDDNTNYLRNRNIDDKFTFECDVDYIEEDESNVEHFDFVRKYFMDLFSNDIETMQVFLDYIKTSLCGVVLRHFVICSGDGCNGKSLLFEILNLIFKNFVDVLSKKIFIQTRDNSHLNSEFEKLNKCRVGFVSELPKGSKLNETNIKEISGGDRINLRTLNKTDETLISTCNIVMLVNDKPKFSNDEAGVAIKDRLINFPFKNTFEKNPNYKDELMKYSSHIFSYIMTQGKIISVINPTMAMLQETNEYLAENTQDNLAEFIDDFYEITNDENDKIKRDDLRLDFNNWCSERRYKINNDNNLTFTKNFNKKFGTKNKDSNHIKYFTGIKRKIFTETETLNIEP
jgi:phage/plasmid-associated DNA primase